MLGEHHHGAPLLRIGISPTLSQGYMDYMMDLLGHESTRGLGSLNAH